MYERTSFWFFYFWALEFLYFSSPRKFVTSKYAKMERFAKIVNGFFSQHAPSYMFDRVLNTLLQPVRLNNG